MISTYKKIGREGGTTEFELKGLSTDEKPTGTFSGGTIGVNSIFIELDTGDLYYYNGSTWEEISMSGGGSGAGLPAVTASDNGSILKVIEGAWGKGDAPSAELSFLHGTLTFPQGVPTFTVTETADEIRAVIATGNPIILRWTMIYPETGLSSPPNDVLCNARLLEEEDQTDIQEAVVTSNFVFTMEQGKASLAALYIAVSGQVQTFVSTVAAYEMPAFTSADSGKVLGVNSSGALAWVTP